VHYEYANRLAARGHTVTVIAPVRSRRTRFGIRRRGVERTLRQHAWFDFDHRVRLAITDGRSLPDADVVVVTGWQTAALAGALARRPRRIAQIAYDYEVWMTADAPTRALMAAAFAVPDVVIATSGAVASMLRAMGHEPAASITCAIDHDRFRITRAPPDRRPDVGFLGRPGPAKRGEDAVDALARVRRTHDVRVVAVRYPELTLPGWVHGVDAPTDTGMRDFYNGLMVYLLPSAFEGWGLTAVEAMACGAAVVTTDNGGVDDFAVDGANALVVPPADPQALAAACTRLLDDAALRARLVDGGLRTARAMRWDPSVDALEEILLGLD
jgi:glycosyltransferase involved in cell wall biosynthesis